MSRAVYIPALVNPNKLEEWNVLHLVPDGHDECVQCGKSRLQMRFHHTNQVGIFLSLLSDGPHTISCADQARQAIAPYTLCGTPPMTASTLTECLDAAGLGREPGTLAEVRSFKTGGGNESLH